MVSILQIFAIVPIDFCTQGWVDSGPLTYRGCSLVRGRPRGGAGDVYVFKFPFLSLLVGD